MANNNKENEKEEDLESKLINLKSLGSKKLDVDPNAPKFLQEHLAKNPTKEASPVKPLAIEQESTVNLDPLGEIKVNS